MLENGKIELLAPAGNPTNLKAAVEAGADAVYMGSGWNARLRAKNFTKEELFKAISYCHQNNVKAYITLNTLIFEEELQGVANYIAEIYSHGADAVIVQDIGVARIAKETGKDMQIHASTQMSVHNSKTAKMLKNFGFSRAVLARELNVDQVKRIRENSGLEVEVFVHGALCYSYSGKCLWSFYQTGRSGNRGVCAQLCRFPWKVHCRGQSDNLELKGYLTSTKDLNLLDKIPEIQKAGIDCVKIEGRLKDSKYVRDVVGKYRAKIDGKEPKWIASTPRGYTGGYLFEDARINKLINPASQRFSGEKIGKVISVSNTGATVQLFSTLRMGDSIRISSSGKAIEVFRIYERGKEVKESSDKCILKIKTLRKGDIVFKVEREETDEAYLAKVKSATVRKAVLYKIKHSNLDLETRSLFFMNSRQKIAEAREGQLCVLSWEDADSESLKEITRRKATACVDTPRIIFDEEMPAVENKMKELAESDSSFMVSELSLLSGYPSYVSHYANVTNTLAANEWISFGKGNVKGIISSVEVPCERAKNLGMMCYNGNRLELAISENNWYKEFGISGECELVDPRGNHFPIKTRNGKTVIMQPLKKKKQERR